MAGLYEKFEELIKTLEAGGYNAAPDTLRQGPALQVEDCSAVMHNVTFGDKHIILQKMLKVSPVKSTFSQFNRQLSVGRFGGSAQHEGRIGPRRTGKYVRAGVAIAFYSEIRETTLASNMVKTQTGEKPADLESDNAALNIAADVEFDCFGGKDDFSAAGVFDGNPTYIPALPNMTGIGVQIRQSDAQLNTQDAMFNAFGGSLSNIVSVGGNLTQPVIEDLAVRSNMNHGSADQLIVDPLVKSAYNKLVFGKERIQVGGSPVDVTGGDLRRQHVMDGVVQVKSSRFLSGRTGPARTGDPTGPAAPTHSLGQTNGSTSFLNGQVYYYYVTAENEIGESVGSTPSSITIGADGRYVSVTITAGTNHRFFNVYRSAAGGTGLSSKFIGRVMNSGAATTVFTDLGNKLPGFVTGYLIQDDVMDLAELAPFSRMKLAVHELAEPEAAFRFVAARVFEPRKLVIAENCSGDLY
jgi:hypothetical protein